MLFNYMVTLMKICFGASMPNSAAEPLAILYSSVSNMPKRRMTVIL